MFEKILVPLDGSELSEQALPVAEELVGRLGSRIAVLQVSESTESGLYHMQELYINQIAQRVTNLVKKYRADVQVEPVIIIGSAADEIIKYVDRNNIGLVVMGTHGRSGITRWAVGSVASKVVRGTKTPVLMIRTKGAKPSEKKRLLSKVLVPLDGSEVGEAALPFITELALKLEMEVVLFQVVALAYHVYSSGEIVSQVPYTEQEMEPIKKSVKSYLDKVAEKLTAKGLKVSTEIKTGAAAESIIKAAEDLGVDLVAMSTHGRSGVSRWVFGSVAARVLQQGTTPLLLVRAAGASVDAA
ncbi:MAG: universal stress protein [Chloroflexota bacterium]